MGIPAVTHRRSILSVGLFILLTAVTSLAGPRTDLLTLRGRPQTLHLYGPPRGAPVILSSGDGGWIHLGPQVAQMLAARGFFVVGVDSKAYLESFTSATSALMPREVAADFHTLIGYASRATGQQALLVGISEGAGLSVLAAAADRSTPAPAGVIAIGLGDRNELAWRWKDSVIYLTHGVPSEPTFSVAALADRVAPIPLALIASTHDKYVPKAEVDRIMAAARAPKRLWTIDAADHRFSDQPEQLASCLADAIAWVHQNGAR
jgi:alpha-beta hydrolase superfamily lysophospholipase